MTRRQFLIGAGVMAASGIAYAGRQFWPDQAFSNPCMSDLPHSIQQDPLYAEIWAGINPYHVWDCHVHLTGVGDSASGVWFNPTMNSWTHPILRMQKHFYMNGGCVDNARIDASYAARLQQLSAEMPAGFKSMLFAFDFFHDESGNPVKENSIFYIANDYASTLATQYPQQFEWVASIHPYRADALDALDETKAKGARAIKWLPSGMGIDPASPKCDAFYKKLADLNLPIISHTGAESAVQGGDQRHGNPLRIRRALDAGVRVVLAHCASDGNDEDLDNHNKQVKSFALFSRLMDSPDYKTRVFGEISALTLINHAWAIPHILKRDDWQNRLINGSDYPLPGIFPLINLNQLVRMDLLDEAHLPFLQTVKQYNPLLYDFAVKRLIRHTGLRFSTHIFETRRFFDAHA